MTASADPLRDYVAREQAALAWEVVRSRQMEGAVLHQVRLTSQVWRGRTWTHWLTLLVPGHRRHEAAGLLILGGGRNRDAPPEEVPEAERVLPLVTRLGVPVAVLEQVPNQPLLGGLREDALIAETFDRFLESGEEDWPLLLPMTRSAVSAMDAIDAITRTHHAAPTRRFIVGGASKRGWTSYLTAAVDKRVIGIVPIVIDILNMGPQIRHQIRSYGEPSEMIREYRDLGILDRLGTPAGRRLVSIVDPYAHRNRLTVPKLIVLGTNDPYWTADAANLYVKGLPGANHLHYGMNQGHAFGLRALPSLFAFAEHVYTSRPLPGLTWERAGGALTVDWTGKATRFEKVHARSPTRDFREARWRTEPVAPAEGARTITLDPGPPESGYRAFYLHVTFETGQPPAPAFSVSTPITILPQTFPGPAGEAGAR